jgi:hypothetical protein
MLSLTVAAAAVPAMGDILDTQPTTLAGAFASQNDTTGGHGNFATVYDDFTLASDADITSVQWTGSYFNPPTQGTITAFTVDFYADSGGTPGALLQSFNVAGTNGESSLGNDSAGDPTYAYSMNVNFISTAGTKYWMSIVPDLGFPPQWGWEAGTGGDGIAYQDFFGTLSEVTSDMAFQLNGTTVPEPISVGLMGSVVVALGLAKLRRNRA